MNRSWNFAMSYVSDKKVILAILIFFFVISLSKSNVESNKKGNDDVKEQIEKLLKDDAAVDIKTTEFLATTESISLDNAHKPEESKKPSISVAGIDDDGKRTDAKFANISSPDIKKSETNNDNDSSNNEELVSKKNVSETVEEAFLPAEGAAEQEHSSSLAIFFVLFVLVLCIFLIHFILQNKCHYIPESLAIVFLGAFVGAVIKVSDHTLRKILA